MPVSGLSATENEISMNLHFETQLLCDVVIGIATVNGEPFYAAHTCKGAYL